MALGSHLRDVARWLPQPLQRRLEAFAERLRDVRRARALRSIIPIGRLESPRCAICGSDRAAFHHRYNGFDIVRCLQDGLLFVSPRPRDLTPYYREGYYHGAMPGVYEDYAADAARSRTKWEERLTHVASLTAGRDLLDVGCANGAFLALARSHGWN